MAEQVASGQRCFFEHDPSCPLYRRAFVEFLGTCLLAISMVGSGLAVQKHLGSEPVVAGFAISVSIAGALVGLIVSLGKVSGGHFNPLITSAQWLRGERHGDCTIAYVVGQTMGAVLGAKICGLMFGELPNPAHIGLASPGTILSEIVASAGLMIVVIGCIRSSKWETGPFAVGAWLTAAILATPSTSYANPAVTIAAAVAAGPVALSTKTAAAFVVAQLVGMLVAMIATRIAFAGQIMVSDTRVANGGKTHDAA